MLRLEAARRQQQGEKEQRRQRQEEERRRHEEVLERDLEEMTDRWTRATRVRGFLAAVREALGPERLEEPCVARWLESADAWVLDIDPLSSPGRIAKRLELDAVDPGS